MGPRTLHQQFLFRNFFLCRGLEELGPVRGPIFPGAHVGKIIPRLPDWWTSLTIFGALGCWHSEIRWMKFRRHESPVFFEVSS